MKYSTLVLLGLIAISDTQALKIYQLEEPKKEEKKEETKAEAKETAKETSSGDGDCYDHPYGSDKQKKCFNDIKDQVEKNGIDSYNRKLKDDEDHAKKNTEFRDGVQSQMRKENEYINGGKKIEGREGPPLKKAGWDVPMDEQTAHPMLKEPSTPDKAD